MGAVDNTKEFLVGLENLHQIKKDIIKGIYIYLNKNFDSYLINVIETFEYNKGMVLMASDTEHLRYGLFYDYNEITLEMDRNFLNKIHTDLKEYNIDYYVKRLPLTELSKYKKDKTYKLIKEF